MAWYHHLLRNPFLPSGSAAPTALTDPAPAPASPQVTRPHSSRVRSFAAGTPSRLTAGLVSANSSLDSDLLVSLNTLRARSRHLTQNNPYGVKYLAMVSANVVGHQGFTLQARCSESKYLKTKAKLVVTPDNIANRALEAAFAVWSERGTCEVTGKHSFADLCRLFARTVAGDGEVLVRRLRGKTLNAFGYALQILDIDRLEVNYNAQQANGNIVRMGVEIDTYGRPVAYWLRGTHPNDSGPGVGVGVQRERVPAADIFHCFIASRPEQRRGYPWMAAAIESLYHLGELDQSALVAARKGADTLGFFVSPDGSLPNGAGEGADPPIEVSVAGTFDTLPEGYDLRAYESQYPSAVYGEYVKANLRRVASALGVSYNGLANDLEGVNFSSIRAGLLEERELWMQIQDWMIDAFLIPVYRDWLQMALGLGAVVMENGSALPAAKYDKFAVHTWQGRRWPWVDPLKDIEAAISAVNAGLDSPQRQAAEQGRDIEDVLDDISAFQAMVKEKGIVLSSAVVPPKFQPADSSSTNPPNANQ